MKSLIAFLTVFIFSKPYSALACAVCFVGKGGSSSAYLGTAIVLSLLPLGMVGGIIFWVYHRHKQSIPQKELVESESLPQ